LEVGPPPCLPCGEDTGCEVARDGVVSARNTGQRTGVGRAADSSMRTELGTRLRTSRLPWYGAAVQDAGKSRLCLVGSASGGQLRHDSNPSGHPIIQGLSFDPFLPAASFSSAVSRFAPERVRSRFPAQFGLASLRR
jgi:hypothetical protein